MKRLIILAGILPAATLSLLCTAQLAVAAPVLRLEMHHGESNFQPGGVGEYWFTIYNVGNEATAGPITLSVTLPPGLSRSSANEEGGWSCPGAVGDAEFTCTSSERLPLHKASDGGMQSELALRVKVSPSLAGQTVVAEGLLEGGGAEPSSVDFEPTEVKGGSAPFGIVANTFKVGYSNQEESEELNRPGSHPDLATFAFETTTVPGTFTNQAKETVAVKNTAGSLRDLEVTLPAGFVGNPSVVAECKPAELVVGECPSSSQVGRIDVTTEGVFEKTPDFFFENKTVGVYNMVHPRGTVADLAFSVLENVVHLRASLDPAAGYAIKTEVPNINQTLPVFWQKLTLWGVPADPRHNSERCRNFDGTTEEARFVEGSLIFEPLNCSSGLSSRPFLTTPSRCGGTESFTLRRYDSWQQSGAFGPDMTYERPGPTDCTQASFEPALTVQPTTGQAGQPTGLGVSLKVPQNENPNGQATPPVKAISVKLPEGMTLSTSAANGLAACSQSEFGISGISFGAVPTAAPVECPASSRLGSVSLRTPLLGKNLQGSVYLAAQRANPFGSTFAIYMALEDVEERGVLIKLPGKLVVDGRTGQIATYFDQLPQLPFEEVSLSLREGPRAPLINSGTCGPQTVEAQVSSWAQETAPVALETKFSVGGPACDARPFEPTFSAGTVNPTAGKYAPFVLRMTRTDLDQNFSRIQTTLPQGLLAKIAGIPLCSDAAVAALPTLEGSGAAQIARPICPSSRIGTVSTGVGAGLEPQYVSGGVYLAGPYHGDPLSLGIVIPAVAGPFDLGNVVVRAGISIDPTTAQVTAKSDAFPTILDGVPLSLRDLRFLIDRPTTTLNPTSCAPMHVKGVAASVSGEDAALSDHFQVGSCKNLPFKPKLSLTLSGPTRRAKNPSLRAVLTTKAGQANIGKATIILPSSEFIDNRHINNPCTRVEFNAGSGNGEKCPAKSVLGYARATTPLLDHPLEGPVYLRSNGGDRELPDLVAALHGTFNINLVGYIDSVHRKGSEASRVRTRFVTVPDASVKRFVLTMKGGQSGLLQNSTNICKTAQIAKVAFVAQDNAVKNPTLRIGTSCPKE